MEQQQNVVDVTRRLAEALVPGDLDSTLAQVTAAAVEVLPDVDYASITIKRSDGRLETVAPTDDLLKPLDKAQYELREGPCYYAATKSVHITSPDLAADQRFPKYAAIAVAAGIHAQAGLQLFDNEASQGALNLYSLQVGAFSDLELLGPLFAHQSAMAIDYAREIESVREAVHSRGIIGQAVGILMERYRLDDARAFGFLLRLSQNENIKVRVLAEDLVARSTAEYETGR
ncbi:GAF and ANTAR domain-containing protein [Nocardioides antri]|uniref:GAF and ANTAR domain-containing protein n=1 Tax=Nocardioides antri TaxID=2607659 RepID=A0A5B1LZA6_9ACTN|nr:GAF and ANTAR domain-containing protein [Nocardioides antri]KAA1426013.1 GAF and ANTAR domain-containing protein [Nocardioides antri]